MLPTYKSNTRPPLRQVFCYTEKKGGCVCVKLEKSYQSLVKPHLEDIQHLRNEGYSVQQICKFLGITERMFYSWLSKHEDFYRSWEAGQPRFVMQLEQAAAKSALGHYYQEVDDIKLYDHNGDLYGRKVIEKTKYNAPNALLLKRLLQVTHPKKYGNDDGVVDNEIKITLSDELDELAE